MSNVEHKASAPKSIKCMIITVSDTRTVETDKSGKQMIDLLEANGHFICDYRIVKDDAESIREAVLDGIANDNVQAILTNGGTGIALRDVTIETLKSMFDKEISGFGEIFRFLSYTEDIGSAAILSRAIAGVIGTKAIFATPGSTGAVKLAMDKLILPELAHVVGELHKDLNK